MDSSTILALETFPDRLEQFFLAIPNNYRNWKPDSWEGIPSEMFTAIEQICHVRDIEIDGYHSRFCSMLEEVEPSLNNVDGYSLAEERHYSASDPKRVFEEISSARLKTLQIIKGLSLDQLTLAGNFEGYGRITMKGLIHNLCSHDQQHLSGMQWLLGKIESVKQS